MASAPQHFLLRRLTIFIQSNGIVRHAPTFLPRAKRSGGAASHRSPIGNAAPTAAASTAPDEENAPTEYPFFSRPVHVETPLLETKNELEPLLPVTVANSNPNGASSSGSGLRHPPQTGAFQRLPMVSPSREIIESALRRAERTGGNKALKNEGARAKNKAARQLDALMKELTGPLGTYERGFPPILRLHPFEKALLELTVGPGTYDRALARVCALRKASVEVAKGYAGRASKAANKKEAIALQVEGFARVEAVFTRGAPAVDELKEIAKSLRRLPVVDPRLPTVALVGAPNVGKSSLVQLLSSGLPEIQNYPFTTRSIKMGHFYVNGRRHQVTDTPGLLNRPDEERNAMERLTLASLQYLPTAVLFVADLTAECGTSVAEQWRIRSYLKERFQEKPWIDVFSKSDLLEEELDEADSLIDRHRQKKLQQQHSTFALGEERDICVTRGPDVEGPVAFAAAVADAQRVSSLTGNGVEELKAAMLRMLEQHELRSEGLEAWGEEVSFVEEVDRISAPPPLE